MKNEILEDKKSLKPVSKLSVREKKLWNVLVKALNASGLTNATDSMLVEQIVKTQIMIEDCEAELNQYMAENGSLMTTLPNGYVQPHNMIPVLKDTRKDLVKFLQTAGMTPSAFAELMKVRKLTDNAVAATVDPLDAFMKSKPKSSQAFN